MIYLHFINMHWRHRGGAQAKSPGRNGKTVAENMLFLKALFLAKAFPQIVKNSIFQLNFHRKCSNSQQFGFFVQTRQTLTQGF